MKRFLLFLLVLLSWHRAFGEEILMSGTRLVSPDSRWEVFVEKNLETEDFTAKFFIAARGSTEHTFLAENGRHFGAQWSPDSKTLLVYDNCGSGQSDTIVFRHTAKGWEEIYHTPGGFHIFWRLDKWLPNAVRLHSHPGGSSPSKVPATVLVPFDAKKPAADSKKHDAPADRK